MQYALLIYDIEAAWADRSQEEGQKLFADYVAFSEAMGKSGQLRGGEPLESISKATTVRVRNGKTLTTDGPFAETKEQLGGFYLVDAKDLDDAIAIAARIPSSKYGSIEVRPVMKFEMK